MQLHNKRVFVVVVVCVWKPAESTHARFQMPGFRLPATTCTEWPEPQCPHLLNQITACSPALSRFWECQMKRSVWASSECEGLPRWKAVLARLDAIKTLLSIQSSCERSMRPAVKRDKNLSWASKGVQQLKVLAAESDQLSSMAGTHEAEGNQFQQAVLWITHECVGPWTHRQMHAGRPKVNKCKFFKIPVLKLGGVTADLEVVLNALTTLKTGTHLCLSAMSEFIE